MNFTVAVLPPIGFLIAQDKLMLVVTTGYEKPFMGVPGSIKKFDFNFETNIYSFEIEYGNDQRSRHGIPRDVGNGGVQVIRLPD